jgi:DNA invertase Pin-like site-specific DNA recombinase
VRHIQPEPDFAEVNGHLVGYARVSTDDQRLDLQIDALVKYGVLPDDIHTDTASGATATRPGFLAMKKDLRAGDTLVAWRLDRLGRDLSQLVQTAEWLRQHKVRLVLLQDGIDTRTVLGRFTFGIMASFAQLEREMIVERTRAGLAAARARGKFGGRAKVIKPEKYAEVERLMLPVEQGGAGLRARGAAIRVGLSPSTYYRHLEEKTRDPE